MKLKLDEEGHAVLSDGKPVYIHDDGKEVAFDAPGTVATITRLNGEAKTHREAKEAAEKALKAFEGIDDPKAARAALETVQNFDQKKLVDAGEVEKVKAEAIKAVEEKYAPIIEERDSLKADLYNEKIGGSFARSKFISEKAAIPADLVQARFGSQFKIEDGKVAAYDSSGNKIYSKARPGEAAEFEEALEILIDAYPYRDQILKGNSHGGGSTRETGGNGGPRSITRAQFDALSPDAKMKTASEGVAITD